MFGEMTLGAFAFGGAAVPASALTASQIVPTTQRLRNIVSLRFTSGYCREALGFSLLRSASGFFPS